MRDIRDDLQARLDEFEVERSQLQRRIEMVGERATHLRSVLELEELRIKQGSLPGLASPAPEEATNGDNPRLTKPLAKFLWRTLADHRPRPLAEIKTLAEAEGFHTDKRKNFGRAVHFALVGLQRNDFVRRLEDGRWMVPNGAAGG